MSWGTHWAVRFPQDFFLKQHAPPLARREPHAFWSVCFQGQKSFFENLEWQKLEPRSEIIKTGPNTNGREVLAAMASDTSFLVAYSPYGMDFSLDLTSLRSENLTAQWFNPRNNTYIDLRTIIKGADVLFNPPADPKEENDWVLLVEAE